MPIDTHTGEVVPDMVPVDGRLMADATALVRRHDAAVKAMDDAKAAYKAAKEMVAELDSLMKESMRKVTNVDAPLWEKH